ncbi:MAG: ornithine cyclodeaminase family protein [Solirubrobacteraceae bacterium]
MPTSASDQIRYVSAAQVRELLPSIAATDALWQGLAARAGDALDPMPRTLVDLAAAHPAGARMMLMPAFGPEGVGVKIQTLVDDNPDRGLPSIQGVYVLHTRNGMRPELLIDAAALTSVRTAAVSAAATRCLARPDSQRLVVFGAGVQAVAHISAMHAELQIMATTIVGSPNGRARAETLARQLRGEGYDVIAGDPGAVRSADLICTCTPSTSPVFSAEDLQPGTHINAVGSYRMDMIELPPAAFAGALLAVETRDSALAEAGDVMNAIALGMTSIEAASELRELIVGGSVRTDPAQLTIFKSVGLAVEDLILARALADRLAKSSRGSGG